MRINLRFCSGVLRYEGKLDEKFLPEDDITLFGEEVPVSNAQSNDDLEKGK